MAWNLTNYPLSSRSVLTPRTSDKSYVGISNRRRSVARRAGGNPRTRGSSAGEQPAGPNRWAVALERTTRWDRTGVAVGPTEPHRPDVSSQRVSRSRVRTWRGIDRVSSTGSGPSLGCSPRTRSGRPRWRGGQHCPPSRRLMTGRSTARLPTTLETRTVRKSGSTRGRRRSYHGGTGPDTPSPGERSVGGARTSRLLVGVWTQIHGRLESHARSRGPGARPRVGHLARDCRAGCRRFRSVLLVAPSSGAASLLERAPPRRDGVLDPTSPPGLGFRIATCGLWHYQSPF